MQFNEFPKLIQPDTIEKNTNDDEKINYAWNRIRCGEQLRRKRKFDGHIRDDKECSTYYKLYYLNPQYCPTSGCNTIRNTESDLEKHLKYRCRLTNDEKLHIHD